MAVMRRATGYDVGPMAKPDAPLPNAGEEYFLRYFGEPTNGWATSRAAWPSICSSTTATTCAA